MPKIVLHKNQIQFEVFAGANLMQSLLDQQIPVASSCGGDGICGKCRIQIIAGQNQLPPPNETETFLAEINDLKKNERISCQTQVLNDIEVDTNYW
ncbi:MAG: 2Fe-2S iron-sulfur cluster-binding protein [Bdellovibrionota bacterium]